MMDDNLSIIEEEMEQLSVTTGEIICPDWLVIICPPSTLTSLTSITNLWTVMK